MKQVLIMQPIHRIRQVMLQIMQQHQQVSGCQTIVLLQLTPSGISPIRQMEVLIWSMMGKLSF